MTPPIAEKRQGEMLCGVLAIAEFMGIRRRQAFHMIDNAGLPVFRVGKTICARPDALRAWIAEREAARRTDRQ